MSSLVLFDKMNKEKERNIEELKEYYRSSHIEGILSKQSEIECEHLINSQNQQNSSDPVFLLIKKKKWSSLNSIEQVELKKADQTIKSADEIIDEAELFFK